jgi:hypothetical protein
MIAPDKATKIIFPAEWKETLLEHCLRKYREEFNEDETHERKAYGLIGGTQDGGVIEIGGVFPLKKNRRFDEDYIKYMTEMMTEHAIESKTPFERRGWVATPQEVMSIFSKCDRLGIHQFGNYHMHLVPWDHDPIRDTCTEIDTALSEESNAVMFIISLVDIDRPIIRAFYEGRNDLEIPIEFPAG